MCQKKRDDEHPNGRRSEAELEELRNEVEALKLQAQAIQETLDAIKKALLGNGGSGILDSMTILVEQLGRQLENLHRQNRRLADVIEGLARKLKQEDVLAQLAEILQEHRVLDARI